MLYQARLPSATTTPLRLPLPSTHFDLRIYTQTRHTAITTRSIYPLPPTHFPIYPFLKWVDLSTHFCVLHPPPLSRRFPALSPPVSSCLRACVHREGHKEGLVPVEHEYEHRMSEDGVVRRPRTHPLLAWCVCACEAVTDACSPRRRLSARRRSLRVGCG